eukprot:5986401-Pyramimonas_sp.AAC.1
MMGQRSINKTNAPNKLRHEKNQRMARQMTSRWGHAGNLPNYCAGRIRGAGRSGPGPSAQSHRPADHAPDENAQRTEMCSK